MLLVLGLTSCSQEKTSLFPIVNSSGEGLFLKPSKFKVTEQTRKSDMMRMTEDIIGGMPSDFPSQLVRLDPDKGEAVAGALLLATGSVREKGKSVDTGVVIPVGVVKHRNVPQERIDAAVPAIQRAYYSQLQKYGQLIPTSRLVNQKQ